MGRRSGRITLSIDVRVGIVVCVLAGSLVTNVAGLFQIGASMVHHVFHGGCEIMMNVLHLRGLPTSGIELHKLAVGFQYSRAIPNPLFGCVEALDGILFNIRKPTKTKVPAAFYS